MNTPLHPLLVHLPLALAFLVPLLAGGVVLAWARNWFPKRTWVLVVAAQALLLGSGWFALSSGEGEEDRVEQVVPETALERHEEAGKIFLGGAGALLALGVVPLLFRNRRISLALATASIAGSLVVCGLAFQVGKTGGALVYEHGAAARLR